LYVPGKPKNRHLSVFPILNLVLFKKRSKMKKCCCCSLRTGSLTIGIFNIVLTFLGIIFWFAFLFAIMPFLTERLTTVRNEISLRKTLLEDRENTDADPTNNLTYEELNTLSQLKEAEIKLNDAMQKLETYDEINKSYFTPVYVIMCVAHLGFSSALVHGIRKKSVCLIRSWIIYYASITVISLFLSVAYYLYMSVSVGQILGLMFGYAFGLAFSIFMLKVVNDYLKEMQQIPFVKQRGV